MFSQKTIEKVTRRVWEILREHSIPLDKDNPGTGLYAKVYVNDTDASFASDANDICTYKPGNVIVVSLPEGAGNTGCREEITAYFENMAQVCGCKVRSTAEIICLCNNA